MNYFMCWGYFYTFVQNFISFYHNGQFRFDIGKEIAEDKRDNAPARPAFCVG